MAAERRTQAERRLETQGKLLDATLACLVEHGYAGTTAERVVTRAGLTRGAQTHYYPTMNDLVVAAVNHLAAKRARQAMEAMLALAGSKDPVGALLDLIWDIHTDEMFTATVELWVAARTDPELRQQLAVVEPSAIGAMQGLVRAAVVERSARQQLLAFTYTAMDTVRGLLLGGFAVADPEQVEQRWRRARGHLRQVAEASLADAGVTMDELLAALRTGGAPAATA